MDIIVKGCLDIKEVINVVEVVLILFFIINGYMVVKVWEVFEK